MRLVVGHRRRCSTRRATCSGSSTTTAASRRATHPSGARSSAARGLRGARGQGARRGRDRCGRPRLTRHADGVDVDDDGSATASTSSSSPPTPTGPATADDPTDAERAGTRRLRVLAQRDACCTPTTRCCPRAAGPRLVELPHDCCPAADQVQVSYWMNRLHGFDEPPIPGRHSTAAADRPDAGCCARWPTSTRSTPGSRWPPSARVRADDRPHRLRRRLPRLGFPRGRLPGRRRGRPPARCGLAPGWSAAP